jgi:hypothetical protein
VPVTDCCVGELEASLTKLIVPDAVPVFWGVNVTANCRLCPALMDTGKEIPLTTNSESVLDTEETVTVAPLAVRFAFKAPLLPTTTFPKFRLAGETLSCPWAVPVPDNAIVVGELLASETRVSVPLEAPTPLGENVTVKVMLWFVERLVGSERPL